MPIRKVAQKMKQLLRVVYVEPALVRFRDITEA